MQNPTKGWDVTNPSRITYTGNGNDTTINFVVTNKQDCTVEVRDSRNENNVVNLINHGQNFYPRDGW